MDALIQMVAIMAVFSMMHERVLELLRLPLGFFRNRGWTRLADALDSLTAGTFNWLIGVALALLTHADLLAATRPSAEGKPNPFVDQYLQGGLSWSAPHFLGCLLMGFSTTLGSKFWHDLLSGLTDFRKQLKGVPAKAQELIGPEVRQNLLAVAEQMRPVGPGDTASSAAITSVANALKDAVTRVGP